MNGRPRMLLRPVCAGLAVILVGGALLAQEGEQGQATTLAGMLVGIDEDNDGDFERV